MFKYIGALLFTFLTTFFVGPLMLPMLKRLKFGQPIYKLGPKSHYAKQGTPTMGGLVFAITVVLAAFLFHGNSWQGKGDFIWPLLFVTVGNMAVGFIDDYLKVSQKNSSGLSARGKIIGQIIVAAAFSLYCYYHPQIGSGIYLPFSTTQWNLGILYIPLMTLLIIFMTNSANLQDGVDGLLASVSSISTIGMGFVSLIMFFFLSQKGQAAGAQNLSTVAVFSFALAGTCLGFLRINYHPAKVFMGDTGSMFLGGGIVGAALLLKQPFLLVLLALPMIVSSLSVIIQRIYFKATHGKRIFKMSPLHHHFELSGLSEGQIVMLYMVVSILCTLIALLGTLAIL